MGLISLFLIFYSFFVNRITTLLNYTLKNIVLQHNFTNAVIYKTSAEQPHIAFLGYGRFFYINGYLKYINAATGRIHPDLLPLATETGRFVSKNPNCQNMSRSGADDIGVRNFITAQEGKILLSLDF